MRNNKNKLTLKQLENRVDKHEKIILHSEKRIDFYLDKINKKKQIGFTYKRRN